LSELGSDRGFGNIHFIWLCEFEDSGGNTSSARSGPNGSHYECTRTRTEHNAKHQLTNHEQSATCEQLADNNQLTTDNNHTTCCDQLNTDNDNDLKFSYFNHIFFNNDQWYGTHHCNDSATVHRFKLYDLNINFHRNITSTGVIVDTK
jgi:hypothetical protein